MNWPLLQNSLLVAAAATALAVCFGLATALWLATLEVRWRNVFLALAVMALALPPFLVTNCWIDLLGETSAWRLWLPLKIYSLGGTIWILSLLLWPITLFATLAGWRRLEAAQFECEPVMTGFALLRWLLIPAAKGELALAAVLTFVLALNNFAVPAILQTKVLPDEMWVRFNTQFDAVGAFKLSVPLVLAPVLLLAWVARRGVSWPRVQGTVSPQVFRRQLGTAWRIGAGVMTAALCVVSVGFPVGQIAFAKRTWAELAGAIEASRDTTWNSFWFAALAATLVIGMALAFCSHRHQEADCHHAKGFRLLTSAATVIGWLPFFIPGVLIGIALIKVFNRPVLVVFYQSVGICLLALVIRYFALAWTAARHALASVDTDLIDVARLEGATRGQMFRFVVWPQIGPQMFAAWYVVYLLCLWDVESIVLVQPPGGETLALRIFNLLHYGHAAQVNALCVVLLGVAVLPLMVWSVWSHLNNKVSGTAVTTGLARLATICAVVGLIGCSPMDGKNATSLHSQFFERAEVIGTRGVGIGEFNKPRSVTVDLSDNLYAVDITGRVQKFSPTGEFILSWQVKDIDRGRPKGMCCDAEGNIVVGEPHYQRINHFTPDGRLVRQWGIIGTNSGELTFPRSEAINSRGELLLSEYTTVERVQRFVLHTNAAPTFAADFGKPGTGEGEFNRAEGICVDAADRIYVADSCNHRIQIFSPDGKFIRQYGRAGSGLGELSYPYDIKVDARGYQFVCEFGNSRIQVFDPDGQPVEVIGGPGAEAGRFANPWSVALDARGNLYVADSQNHRVQKLVRRAGQIGLLRPMENEAVRLFTAAATTKR